jgi:antirestriction protein ArdC
VRIFATRVTRRSTRLASDRIVLPGRSAFETADGYYATALHELAHWTGHKSRLDRDFTGRFGTEAYAVEELIAEIECRVPVRPLPDSEPAAAQRVHRELAEGPEGRPARDLRTRQSHAQKAADYLLAPADQSPQATLKAA